MGGGGVSTRLSSSVGADAEGDIDRLRILWGTCVGCTTGRSWVRQVGVDALLLSFSSSDDREESAGG